MDLPPAPSDEEYRLQRQEELSADLSVEKWHQQPLTVFVFGASGDLAKKKTYPALFDLFKANSLSSSTLLVGYARSNVSDEDFRAKLKPYLMKQAKNDENTVNEFLALCIYRNGQYDDPAALATTCQEVREMHSKMDDEESCQLGVENRVFYLALPPTAFVDTSRSIKQAAMSPNGFNRVVVEKPFGHDTESAGKLGRDLGEIFSEEHLYRIDHYLGKEMVQNLIVLRFGNSFLEPIWNRNYVKSVVVTFKEDIGTMGRGGYFDKSGIIRDVMQNHLMQVLSIVAMESPIRVAGQNYSDFVRDEKVKALRCIKPIRMEDVVIGQYVGNDSEPGYLDDETVPKGSKTPTYCACVMYVDNARWSGVPFIMKAGKALDNRKAEVRIQLKAPPGVDTMFAGEHTPLNELVIRLQPSEAIYLKTNVKKPGLHTLPVQSELDLSYDTRYSNIDIYDAYTRLVLDVLRGKQATFVRNDELMAAWEIFTPILKKIEAGEMEPKEYVFGSRGPAEADELVRRAGYVRNVAYEEDWKQAKEQNPKL